MIFTVQETLLQIWENVKPFVSGITIGGIITTGFYAMQGALTRKIVNKIDYEKISADTQTKALDKIGKTTLNINIQPIVEKSMVEFKNEFYKEQLALNKELKQELQDTRKLVVAMASMFEDSVVMSDEKKALIKQVQEEIEHKEEFPKEIVLTVEGLVEEPKVEKKPSKKQNTIVR